jgi:hypothetical protein
VATVTIAITALTECARPTGATDLPGGGRLAWLAGAPDGTPLGSAFLPNASGELERHRSLIYRLDLS